MQWYTNFYEECRKGSPRALECIQEPGDLLFVPSTWWHTALNLEESIAVTQNFVSTHNLNRVAKFLRAKSNPDLWRHFQYPYFLTTESA